MKIIRATWGFLLSLIFLFIFAYMISGVKWIFENSSQNQNSQTFSASISGAVENIQQVLPPDISAESVISVESNLSNEDKILFEKNSETKLPIASLTKLMTAVIVLDNYSLSSNITVDKIADSQDPMKQDVKLGDTMPVESFLEIMLVESSNKSAYALSELIGEQKFVELMNQKAAEIGLQNTYFNDPTGLSDQNVSTASDLVKLAKYILKNYPKISDISGAKEFYIPNFGKVENTDQLLGEVPEIVCSKTGFTTQAKGCLLLVIRPKGHPAKSNDYLINVILGADDRFSEMKKLISSCN